MDADHTRVPYLDNIRNVLVYNVVLLHILQMFAYPLLFWWAVTDKKGSSRFYETSLAPMDVYLMPCLLFIAALFIFPSLKKNTPLEYLKKRFLRLCIPAVVFLFCAGDIFFQLLLNRLNPVPQVYWDTFLNYWRAFADLPAIYLSMSQKTLNTITFNMQHVWFLTLLFFITGVVILLTLPFKEKNSGPVKVDGRKTIIVKTILFAAASSIVCAAGMICCVRHGIDFGAWLIIGKVAQVQIGKIPILLLLFLFGLYMYKKEWLTRGDIGSWKIWGVMALILIGIYAFLFHTGILPALDEILKAVDQNMQSVDQMAIPAITDSLRFAFLCTWILSPPICIFLLMFFLSFAKRFFNKTSSVTTFCSKHSINVYVLHYIPVLLLQYTFLNVPIPSMIKIILMVIIIIPACLWLSHRLVYPYPKIAIGFFVALKLAALVAGFTFYYFALLALIGISFAGAVYEAARYMANRKAHVENAT